MSKRDYYEVLGVPKDASDAEIKEFNALPRSIGPARGRVFDILLAAKKA